MSLNYKIIRIGASGLQSEIKQTFPDCFAACVAAVNKNITSHVTRFFVVRPSGKCMSIADQKSYLSFSQGV